MGVPTKRSIKNEGYVANAAQSVTGSLGYGRRFGRRSYPDDGAAATTDA